MTQPIRAAAYCRVSTGSQSTGSQERELRAYAVRRGWKLQLYRDEASGRQASRPGLSRLLDDCRKGRVDLLLCWRCDRLARSLKNLVDIMEELKQLRVGFVSANEGIDTTSGPGADLIWQIFGVI